MPLRNAPASAAGRDFAASFNLEASSATVPWQVANTAVYLASVGRGTITKVGIHVITPSGNISVGVYSSTGAGRDRLPVTRVATTGAIACPAAGYTELTLDVPVTLSDGFFFGVSCDNATASFLGSSGNPSSLYKGLSYTQPTAHPLPATVGTVAVSNFRIPAVVGVV